MNLQESTFIALFWVLVASVGLLCCLKIQQRSLCSRLLKHIYRTTCPAVGPSVSIACDDSNLVRHNIGSFCFIFSCFLLTSHIRRHPSIRPRCAKFRCFSTRKSQMLQQLAVRSMVSPKGRRNQARILMPRWILWLFSSPRRTRDRNRWLWMQRKSRIVSSASIHRRRQFSSSAAMEECAQVEIYRFGFWIQSPRKNSCQCRTWRAEEAARVTILSTACTSTTVSKGHHTYYPIMLKEAYDIPFRQ